MSAWYEPEEDDISIDECREKVDIYVTSDDWGSIYISLTQEQIKKIYEEFEAMEPRNEDMEPTP